MNAEKTYLKLGVIFSNNYSIKLWIHSYLMNISINTNELYWIKNIQNQNSWSKASGSMLLIHFSIVFLLMTHLNHDIKISINIKFFTDAMESSFSIVASKIAVVSWKAIWWVGHKSKIWNRSIKKSWLPARWKWVFHLEKMINPNFITKFISTYI